MAAGWLPVLYWEKDSAGYELEERFASNDKSIFWVVGKGGPRERVKLVGLTPPLEPLFVQMANIGACMWEDIDKRTLAFVNRYGLPTTDKSTNEMSVADLDEPLSKLELATDYFAMQAPIDGLIWWELGQARPDAALDKSTLNLHLDPGTLTSFAYLQVLYAAQKGITVKRCAACDGFMVVKNAKRLWCGEACKKRAARRKQSVS